MGYKMKGFSGFGVSPAKQKQQSSEKGKINLQTSKAGQDEKVNKWIKASENMKPMIESFHKLNSDVDLTKKPVGPVVDKNKQMYKSVKDALNKYSDNKKKAKGKAKLDKVYEPFNKLNEKKIKEHQDNWSPAFPGADHSQEELDKMTEEQKEQYYN